MKISRSERRCLYKFRRKLRQKLFRYQFEKNNPDMTEVLERVCDQITTLMQTRCEDDISFYRQWCIKRNILNDTKREIVHSFTPILGSILWD